MDAADEISDARTDVQTVKDGLTPENRTEDKSVRKQLMLDIETLHDENQNLAKSVEQYDSLLNNGVDTLKQMEEQRTLFMKACMLVHLEKKRAKDGWKKNQKFLTERRQNGTNRAKNRYFRSNIV